MSIRTTLILAVVVALLGALYMFGEKVKAPDDDPARPKLVSVTADEIKGLELTTGNTQMSLEKKGDVWIITAPYKGLASSKTLQNLVSQLTDMRADRVVNEDPPASVLAQYGLDKPAFVVKMRTEDGSTAATVAFGLRSPSETGWYARVNDRGDVLLAGNAIAADILRSANGWRETSPLPIDVAQVDRIAATGDGVDAQMRKEAEKTEKTKDKDGDNDAGKDEPENAMKPPAPAKWTMEKPQAGPADAQSVTGWLMKLLGVQVATYFDKMPPNDPKLTPTYTLKIWNKDEHDPMVLTVGAKTDGGWFATRTAAGVRDVFLLPQAALASVKLEPSEMCDKHLFPALEVDKATHVDVVEADTGEASAVRSASGWSFDRPAAKKDEMGKILALLYTLKDLKFEHRVTDPNELAKARASLEKPQARFAVTDEKGRALATLRVGGAAPMARRYVKGLGDDVYTADASFADEWKTNIRAITNSAAPSPAPAASGAAATP